MKLKLFVVAINVVLASSIANAQYNHFEKISEANGLCDNRVTCFMKDHVGFLWIGTENGLNRYDGHSFRIYKPGQSKHRLSHERINHIEEDAKGRLWVSTWNGLNMLDPVTDSLTVFSPDESDEQSRNKLNSTLIWCSYASPGGDIWIAPDARDLCRYNETTNTFYYYPWREFVKKIFPAIGNRYMAIHKVVPFEKDKLLLGTTQGLFIFQIDTQTFSYVGGDANEDCVFLEYDERRHLIWFSQANVYHYDVIQKKLENLSTRVRPGILQNLSDTKVIPTTAGLFAFHTGEGWLQRASIDEKQFFTLHHEKVNAVYSDKGALWIGAADGIRHFDPRLDRFHFTAIFPDTLHTTAGNVYHILEERNGKRYFISSYTQHALIIYDKNSGKQTVVKSIEGKSLINCSKTYEDSHGTLWLLTRDQLFVSNDHQHFQVFIPPGIGSYHFLDMVEDPDGNYWFAAMGRGIYCYRPKAKQWILVSEEREKLYARRPMSLQVDAENRIIWVGDYGFGLFQCALDTDACTYYGMDTADSLSLHSSMVNSITLDKRGDLWIATSSGGIARHRQKTGTFKNFDMTRGIPENTINAIITDNHNDIWLASFKGLSCLSADGKVKAHYDSHHGLPFTAFNTPFSKNAKGELLIGIANGFIKFHPDSLRISTDEFPVVIHEVSVGDTLVDPTKSHTFEYDEQEFTFSFAALTYTLPHQVQYFYQLDGYDSEWVGASAHEAHYTNLENGQYTFRVKAVDYSGRPSANIASIAFVVKPPFWKTFWFYGAATLFIGSLLFLWWRNLHRKIRAQKILREVATSLYNQSTLEDVFWTVARNCITQLHFEDCVIYLLLPDKQVLVQKAAAGPKSSKAYQIINPIEIPLGEGIVGTVAKSGKAEIISNTAKDERYIVDGQRRLSEIAVPIFVDGKVFGVIDSEHPKKRFYKQWHKSMLEEIAAICSTKIGRYFAEDQIRSKVARDLHDDMGSTLSSIKIMSNIALEKNEPTVALHYLKTIRQNATAMQESMSDMVWAINPENDSLEQVIIRMKEFSAEILEPLNIQYVFYEDGDFSRVKLDLNTRKDFYLIFKEALNNAAKYSRCSAVLIHLRQGAKGISLLVEDNGEGFDQSTTPMGNGLRNMRHRAHQIGGSIIVTSDKSKGTSVKLDIRSHDQVME